MAETGMENLNVVIINDLAEIGRLSILVDDFVSRHRLPTRTAFELNLALDELLTNVISYGYADELKHEIQIRGSIVDDLIVIEIEDDGLEFNPFEIKEPDLKAPLIERPIGGLGIHLVRQMIDVVEYRRLDGKNIVVLKKSVPTHFHGECDDADRSH